MRGRWTVTTVLVVALLASAASCGGDDDVPERGASPVPSGRAPVQGGHAPGPPVADRGAAPERVAHRIAVRSGDIAGALVSAADMAGLDVVTRAQAARDPGPGRPGVSWNQLWIAGTWTPPGRSHRLADVASLLTADGTTELTGADLGGDLLAGLRDALDDPQAPLHGFARLVAAESAIYTGEDLADATVTPETARVSPVVMQLLVAGAVGLAVSSATSTSPLTAAADHAVTVRPVAATREEACGIDAWAPWLQWSVRRALYGLSFVGWGVGSGDEKATGEVWRGLYPTLADWAEVAAKSAGLDVDALARALETGEEWLASARTILRWASSVTAALNLVVALMEAKATVSMDGTGPLLRTDRTDRHGEQRTLTVQIVAGANEQRVVGLYNCLMRYIGPSMPSGRELYALGRPIASARVTVTGVAGFGGGLLQPGGWVLLARAEHAAPQIADEEGRVTVDVTGLRQPREVDRSRPVERTFSVRVESSLAGADASTLQQTFFGGLECAGHVVSCVAPIVTVVQQFDRDHGVHAFPLRDWGAEYTLRYTGTVRAHDEDEYRDAVSEQRMTEDVHLVVRAEVPLLRAQDGTLVGDGSLVYDPRSTYARTTFDRSPSIEDGRICAGTRTTSLVGGEPGAATASLVTTEEDGALRLGTLTVRVEQPPVERMRMTQRHEEGPCPPGPDLHFEETHWSDAFHADGLLDAVTVDDWQEERWGGPVIARSTRTRVSGSVTVEETFEIRW